MKSDGQHQAILGKALQNFADNSNAEGHIKISNGKTVAIGRIQVDVAISRNPGYSGDSIAGVPSFLSTAAKTVSNKPVTALRLYACLAVLFVALSIGGGILYAGARSGMLAVGRNPLAKKSIFRSMATVIVMAMVVVIIGVFGVYLILKL
jgi:F0F1-type ATP synthase membrane subunit c/vacuolar-type H+-ATPase subunit K